MCCSARPTALASRWPDSIILAVFGVAEYTRTGVLPIIGTAISMTAEVALTLGADLAGRGLYLLCSWRRDRATFTLLSLVFRDICRTLALARVWALGCSPLSLACAM